MRKNVVCLALCAMLLALCASASAQQPKKVPRIGYLSLLDPSHESTRAEAIRLALRELGYIEGQNIAIEYRPGSDPVETGLVDSLARSGGNITGLTNIAPQLGQLGGKRLELLIEAVPKGARVAVLYEPASCPSVLEVKEVLPVAARALGLTVRYWEVRVADGLEKVFAAMSKKRPDGLYVTTGGLMIANEKRIAAFALKSRLPSTHPNKEFVDAGGLMYYGADLADSYRRVAYYVDRILKGAKPADLPVEQPTKFELVINLKTAKQIGLTIPPNVLVRADRVIK
jgi:putative tryptophan/tyrosine transport system substrate-binding protein